MQNSELAYFSSKSGKLMKQMCSPPFWGMLAWKSGLRSKSHFQAPENAKSANFQKAMRFWKLFGILAHPTVDADDMLMMMSHSHTQRQAKKAMVNSW